MSSHLGKFNIDDVITFTVNTHDPDTSGYIDADSVPSYRVYEDETGTAILTGSMAKLDDTNTTGFYSEQLTLSAANGFENGKSYSIYVAATVGGVSASKSFNLAVGLQKVDAVALSGDTAAADNLESYCDGNANMPVDAVKVSGDSGAADNLEAAYDGAGYAGGTIKQVVDVGAISGDTAAADNLESYCDGNANIPADAVKFSGDATAADNAEAMFEGALIKGTIDDAGAAATDFNGDSSLSSVDDFYNDMYLVITSGTLAGISRRITDYTGSSRNLVFSGENWPATPANSSTFIIIARNG